MATIAIVIATALSETTNSTASITRSPRWRVTFFSKRLIPSIGDAGTMMALSAFTMDPLYPERRSRGNGAFLELAFTREQVFHLEADLRRPAETGSELAGREVLLRECVCRPGQVDVTGLSRKRGRFLQVEIHKCFDFRSAQRLLLLV